MSTVLELKGSHLLNSPLAQGLNLNPAKGKVEESSKAETEPSSLWGRTDGDHSETSHFRNSYHMLPS